MYPVGGMISPYVTDLVKIKSEKCKKSNFQREYNKIYPPILFCSLSLLSIVITLALPETRNQKLPEDIQDVRLGPFLGMFMTEKKRKIVEVLFLC
jgi:hypothetical protein